MKIQHLLISSFAIAALACGCGDDSSNHADDTSVPENTAELCSDNIDNDNNGKTDCDEDSCKVFVFCADASKTCEGAMPEGKTDCVCKDGAWTECKDTNPQTCDSAMPEGKKDCECKDGAWTNCQDEDAKTCEGDMPEGKKDCECVDGEWTNCQDEEAKTCEGDMPEGKKDCECVDGEWTNCQDADAKEEICDNTTDDDGDGKADCEDEDCTAVCVKPCEDGTASCDGKTRNYCEGGILKMEECPFECTDGVCKSCNDINGPDTCEEKDGVYLHTYCSDEGRKTEGCIYGCEDDHCIACIEGSQRCSEDGKSLESCVKVDNKTQWVATPCSGTCEDGRCTGCTNADTRVCKDGMLEICDSNKKYSSEVCEFGCKDDSSCHTCTEGMRSCDEDGKTILICKNDEMTFYDQCTNACKNASCEDENGNHMKDEYDGDWQKAASCKTHSNCGTKFCDLMVNDGTCMNKCVHDTQCIDGYVCRADGRCAPKEFVTVWQTTQPDEKISFILAGGENCNVKVDWGDGTVETITGNYCINRASSHKYATPGEHRVKMSEGNLNGFALWKENEAKLIRIESFGPAGFTGNAFKNSIELKSISKVDIPDASKLTTIAGMFYGASQFNDEMITKWDVSNVKNMKEAFAYTQKFNQDISRWNTSNVTNMTGMFQEAKAFNQSIEQWNTSHVTNMSHMFDGASAFNKPIGSWNVQSVTDMSYMINNTLFNQSINSWNVSNVTDMSYMFANDPIFSQSLTNWNVSRVTNMSHMFSGASKFNSDIYEWKVSNVTDMSYMFYGAVGFRQPIDGWNVSHVKDMQYMFAHAQNFNSYLSMWDVHNVTNMKGMFEEAVKFNNNNADNSHGSNSLGVWNVSNVTDMSSMFKGSACNQDLADWDVSSVTNMSRMFENSPFNQDISNWNVSNVTDMSRMFYNNKQYDKALKNWKKKTAKVKDMRQMFYGATAFNQDVSTWDVANVQNMSKMFYNATSYNKTSNDWNPAYITSSRDCTRLSEMFYNTRLSCSEARSMISNWGLKGVCTANQLRGSTNCD
ncbi:MAG: DUF285 domain-containing protein [Proteobacteria bacterium]|nr:DUF285 domain-containing protein [Pseudomonadota bacterium]